MDTRASVASCDAELPRSSAGASARIALEARLRAGAVFPTVDPLRAAAPVLVGRAGATRVCMLNAIVVIAAVCDGPGGRLRCYYRLQSQKRRKPEIADRPKLQTPVRDWRNIFARCSSLEVDDPHHTPVSKLVVNGTYGATTQNRRVKYVFFERKGGREKSESLPHVARSPGSRPTYAQFTRGDGRLGCLGLTLSVSHPATFVFVLFQPQLRRIACRELNLQTEGAESWW